MISGELFAAAKARGIDKVRLAIYQPRHGGMREHVITLADLEAFAETARQKESTCDGAELMRNRLEDAEWQRIYLNPNPNADDCAFCRAMAVCPAYAARVEEVVEASVPDLAAFAAVDESVPVPVPRDPASLSEKLMAVDTIEAWCSAVRAEAERVMLAGGSVPGFGLELGRQGPRKWVDDEVVMATLRKQMRLSIEDACNLKVKSPTQIEALAKGDNALIGPRQWKTLQAAITRSEPKPSVKPSGLIKKPYVPQGPDAAAFPQVEDNSDLG